MIVTWLNHAASHQPVLQVYVHIYQPCFTVLTVASSQLLNHRQAVPFNSLNIPRIKPISPRFDAYAGLLRTGMIHVVPGFTTAVTTWAEVINFLRVVRPR